jgi:LmbE family N-acetylglucosaminyl deacetylase
VRRTALGLITALLSFLLLLPGGIGGLPPVRASSGPSILVVAPHPDDDLLYAAGVAAAARSSGTTVTVVYMTNGDYYGPSEGAVRQGEAVAGQAVIGGAEDSLVFLGYPDAYMANLLADMNPEHAFTTPFGQSTTYATRGLGGMDYHSYRFGAPGAYNGASVLEDLTAIIESYRPSVVYTTDAFDWHADHRAAFWFVRTALQSVAETDVTYRPVLETTIVHMDDAVWPDGCDPTTPMTMPPSFGETPLSWDARESIPVPAAMRNADLVANPKYRAIDAHQSQGGADGYLGRFVHADEIFWREDVGFPTPTPTPTSTPSPTPSPTPPPGASNVALQATASASSETPATSQFASRAIDGVIDGYPGDYTREWATLGGHAGSWLTLAWSAPMTVDRIVLYDRLNLNDQVTAATLRFSDGSTIATGVLPNAGSAATFSFTSRTITSVQLLIDAVSTSTLNIGLAEIQVYGAPGSTQSSMLPAAFARFQR